MKGPKSIYKCFAFVLTMAAVLCSCKPSIPTDYEEVTWSAITSPDNFGATLPPNITPLNFRILHGDATEAITRLHSKQGGEIIATGWDVCFNVDDWHKLLDQARGDSLFCDIYIKAYGQWEHLPTQYYIIAEEPIDPFITYRLIRPSYVTYEELTLHERSLESFEERVIYENMRFEDSDQGQCINCHMPKNWNRESQSQFHVRQALGGTVFINSDKVSKVNLKTDSTISAGVYPAWHPTQNLIAYSVNETGQVFHTLDPQKVEVIDYASDLILYNLDANTVQHIEHTASDFESFPAWSPDGLTLYYISAHYTPHADNIDADFDNNYDQLHYNIYARTFDPSTCRFGPRNLIFNAEAIDKSASVPRVSPDGTHLLFTLADYGQFHIWHKSADLWLLPLGTGKAENEKNAYPLQNANSLESESYHSWSSNGRWILFSSRRDDGNYTRLYISYLDKKGFAHKPFLLPQRNPLHDLEMLRSYNAAEFLVQAVQPTQRQLRKTIKGNATPAIYAGSALLNPEIETPASRTRSEGRRSESVGY